MRDMKNNKILQVILSGKESRFHSRLLYMRALSELFKFLYKSIHSHFSTPSEAFWDFSGERLTIGSNIIMNDMKLSHHEILQVPM